MHSEVSWTGHRGVMHTCTVGYLGPGSHAHMHSEVSWPRDLVVLVSWFTCLYMCILVFRITLVTVQAILLCIIAVDLTFNTFSVWT